MYRHILLPIDLNEPSSWRKALPTAVEYARAFDSHLTVMTVVPDFGLPVVAQFFPPDFADEAKAAAEKRLAELCAKEVPKGVEVDQCVGYGTIYQEVLDAAKREDCDLILMASHRPELEDYLIGPNAARVVRHATCSVLVVRE